MSRQRPSLPISRQRPSLPIALFALLGALASACGAPQLAPAATSGAAKPSARRLYVEGVALASAGDLTRAEQYLASAHREGKQDRASLVALLSVCVRASRLRSALAYAGPYLDSHPRDARLRQLKAALHFALGELTSARAELERVLVLDEGRAEAHYLLARVHAASLVGYRDPRFARVHRRRVRAHFARYLALNPGGAHAEEAANELESMRTAARRRTARAPRAP